MGLFLVLGWLWPRDGKVPRINRDMVLNLANGALLFLVRVSVVAWVAGRVDVGLIDLSAVGPVWLQALLAFVLLDLTRYAVHFADHRIPWLWTFHRVHHSAEVLDATSGLRMHLVDFVQLSAIPMVLFSVVLDVHGTPQAVIPGVLAVGVVFDAFEHANLRWRLEHPVLRAWDRLFNNPHFHSWHHTRDGHLRDGNYGNALTIWDRLFGTCVSGPQPPAELGLDGSQALDNSLWGWHLLRPRRGGAA